MKRRNRFLLIGSAPYVKEWYEKYGMGIVANDYKLCTMNNAWSVDEGNTYLWLYANDFLDTGHLIPDKRQRKVWKEYAFDHQVKLKPYDYKRGKGTGTMILNSLVYLLNKSVTKGCIVLVAGCDCVYKKAGSHFYGKGTSDPLRYGALWLIKELNRVHGFYKKEDCLVYNVGGQEQTLLPFPSLDPEIVGNYT